MLVTKQLLLAIDFYILFFHTMGVNGYQQLFGYQIIFFCGIFIFGWTIYPSCL